MKRLFLLVAVIGFIQISCTKTNCGDSKPDSLAGKWRMILVKDNASGSTISKPPSISGEVEITFTPVSNTNGNFAGNTPSNEIMKNDYSIGANQSITIPVLSMSKVSETSWGNEFVANIRSAEEYNFENDNTLRIRTANKTLSFRKL